MNKTEKNLISILMPVFNGALYISEAIDSVLAQSYVNWELIIVDDGSTDGTGEIVNKYLGNRVKYFYQENKGVSNARNRCLNEANGEFICLLDSDDILPKESLESRFSLFNNEVNFVDGKVDFVDENNSRSIKTYLPIIKAVNPKKYLLKIDGSCFMGPSWMIRRSSITVPFNENLTHGEDLLFYIANSSIGIYTFTENTVLKYRQQNNSAMKNLKGLELGYLECIEELKRLGNVSAKEIHVFRAKVRMIMFKSFLKNRDVFAALSTLKKF
jgi:glycosyltransferase involved in cell wall biosynthesis